MRIVTCNRTFELLIFLIAQAGHRGTCLRRAITHLCFAFALLRAVRTVRSMSSPCSSRAQPRSPALVMRTTGRFTSAPQQHQHLQPRILCNVVNIAVRHLTVYRVPVVSILRSGASLPQLIAIGYFYLD